MKTALSIVKIGGELLDDPQSFDKHLEAFANLPGKKILIHGGGKAANELSEKLGIPVQQVQGRRITCSESLKVVSMLYAGWINKSVVAKLQALQCNALGLSGADGNSIYAKKRGQQNIDFGFVGDVVQVNTVLINRLLGLGISPVFCALSHDANGQLLNVNADTVATELAKALSEIFEVRLSFCFAHKGVLKSLNVANDLYPQLQQEHFEELKREKVISGGMLPKLENAFDAKLAGVAKVKLGDISLLEHANSGTEILC